MEHEQLEQAFAHRTSQPTEQRKQWARVAGPTAALDISLTRVGWVWTSPCTFRDHLGKAWDCSKDPPAAIAKAMKKAVRLHRLKEIAVGHPDLIPEAGDTGNGRSAFGLQVIDFATTVGKLVSGKAKSLKDTPEWIPSHAAALLSTIANGQWTQARRYAV